LLIWQKIFLQTIDHAQKLWSKEKKRELRRNLNIALDDIVYNTQTTTQLPPMTKKTRQKKNRWLHIFLYLQKLLPG
jgi:hypothetical protein